MIDVPVEVKDALREGTYKKNYRFVVLNDDGTPDETIGTIDNNYLVSESVSIDERMCSGDTLKFGLCEGSSLEFQYFNKPNITGKRVQAFVDVEYGADEPYTIPMGFFDVKKCSRQASTGIIKATCYNKLKSEYLDATAAQLLRETFGDTGTVAVYDALDCLLTDFTIETPIENKHYLYRDTSYNTVSSNVVSAYKYSSLYGDQGALSPGIFRGHTPTVSTSTQISLQFISDYWRYDSSSSFYSWPTRIRFDLDLDAMDEAFYNAIDVQLGKISTATTKAQMWESIFSMNNGLYSKWPFQIIVELSDSSLKRYSKVMYDRGLADGTFSDLARISLLNVKTIYLLKPYRLIYGATSSGNIVQIVITQGDLENSFYMWGGERHYRYAYETFDDVVTVDVPYSPPKFNGNEIPRENGFIEKVYMYRLNPYEISSMEQATINLENVPDVTLRDLQSSVYECECQFGQLSRTTDLFSGVELNHSRLYPADSLYPATDLYPDGAAVSGFKSMYSKLWADEGNIHKWRYLIITYKGLNEDQQEEDFTLQRTVNADGTDDYNMSDNWLFRNLVWTSEQVAEYAEAMVAKMQDMTWFPFEMWCAGLPYLETGDEIEIPLNGESYTSYVLQRQLKGIQNLQDTYINGTLDIF